jgi:hypothetical protein
MSSPNNPWKEAADRARRLGYVVGTWQALLERSLERSRPEVLAQLKQDGHLADFLMAEAASALDLQSKLEEDGTPPETARELALDQLLVNPIEEQDRPEPWQIQDGMDDATVATQQALMSPNPPRSIPA